MSQNSSSNDFEPPPSSYEETYEPAPEEFQSPPPEGDYRKPRRAEKGESEKKPRNIEDFRDGDFFIRSKVVEAESGDIFWLVSPLNKDERDQVFKIKAIVDPSADKNTIGRNLDAQMHDAVQIRMVRRQGSPHWEAWHVGAPPTPKDRVIYREIKDEKSGSKRMPALEWTENLDAEVDKFHVYRNYGTAAEHANSILQNPVRADEVKTEFTRLMLEEVSRVINPKSPTASDQIEDMIERDVSGDSPCSKASVSSMLCGRQESDAGVERVFYSTETSFEKQYDLSGVASSPVKKKHAISALANYCAQKAIANRMVASMTQPVEDSETGVIVSAHEKAEDELVKEQVLFAKNPLLKSEDRVLEERELSEMNAAKVVRSLLAVSGAKASKPEHDDVRASEMVEGPYGAQVHSTVAGEIHSLAQLPTKEDYAANPEGATEAAQLAVIQASSVHVRQTCGVIKKGERGIVWVQKVEGALKSPFKLEGLDNSHELNKKRSERHAEFSKVAEGVNKSLTSFIQDSSEAIISFN